MYQDRDEAGNLLALKLKNYSKTNTVILAIPRGGIPLGYIISKKLNLPLEVVLSKKIGHPLHKEFAIGAVTLKSRILSEAAAYVSSEYIDEETRTIRSLLNERYHDYYEDRQPLPLKGKTLIVVDDGIATGNTMLSIIEMLRDERPNKIVVAIPVASEDAIIKLQTSPYVDDVICPLVPKYFESVGQIYQNFDQVDDSEVKKILNKAFKTISS